MLFKEWEIFVTKTLDCLFVCFLSFIHPCFESHKKCWERLGNGEHLRRNWDLNGKKKIKELEGMTLLKFNSNGGKRGPKMSDSLRSSSCHLYLEAHHAWDSGGPCYCNCSVPQWRDATATGLSSHTG